jgi:acyl-CoA reductase-like NAD-dependent aldehyde dehydrogenase
MRIYQVLKAVTLQDLQELINKKLEDERVTLLGGVILDEKFFYQATLFTFVSREEYFSRYDTYGPEWNK